MNMNLDDVKTVMSIYLSANEETKQEIRDVLAFLATLEKSKS